MYSDILILILHTATNGYSNSTKLQLQAGNAPPCVRAVMQADNDSRTCDFKDGPPAQMYLITISLRLGEWPIPLNLSTSSAPPIGSSS